MKLEDLDLAKYVRAGDTLLWGQAGAEPLGLTRRLMQQRHQIGRIRCFVGVPSADSLRPDDVSYLSYTGAGINGKLWQSGALDILPCHYSELPRLLSSIVDVVFLQLSPPDEEGRFSLGLASEYLTAAIDTARVVIGEVSDAVPWTYGSRTLTDLDLDAIVQTSSAPAPLPNAATSATQQRIAEHVAALIPDGATIQYGLGSLPAAILSRLDGHRDLGIHSGLIDDTTARLMQAGVITNRRKSKDTGQTVTGVLMGTEKLFRYAHRNPAIQLRDTAYTHDPRILAAQYRFTAINSAFEVDLTGQVNAEYANGVYAGAVGGAMDFLRGAARSEGGLPIVALPATAGAASRIVARIDGPVSTPRADAGVIVTEFGVADLRGQPLRERRERMLAIAHPDHRALLEMS